MSLLGQLFGFLALFAACVDAYTIRPAYSADVTIARKILFEQAMNPLSVSKQTLLVACEDSSEAGESMLVGFGQIRPLNEEFSELASLYVVPERRNEGIGSAIVSALLDRHKASKEKLCLLTLKPTTKFYESFGFQVASEVQRQNLPSSLQLEYKAGKVLSFILGNELECMIRS